jgi:hypothetical protein
MRRTLAALIALALLPPAAAAAAAAAQGSRTNAPPGNSAIDEYLETVPGASGNGVPRPPVAGGATLTAAERNRLERLGSAGRTLARIVESTSPPPASGTTSPAPKKHQPATGVVRLPDPKGDAPLGAVLGVAEGDGGMGLLLPAILLASLLAVIGLVLLRRRSAS